MKYGKHNIITALAITGLLSGTLHTMAAPKISFNGASLRPVQLTPEKSTGLDEIYVLYNTDGVSFSIPVTSPANAKLYKYSNLGGGYAQEVTGVTFDGNNLILANIEGNTGYIVEDGTQRYYYWIVNYQPFRFTAQSITLSPETSCESTILAFNGHAEPIHYYAINGQQKVLERAIRLEYDTQVWNSDNMRFENVEAVKTFDSIGSVITVTPPAYSSTYFTLTGDQFLTAWNWTVSVESEVVNPTAVLVETTATQLDKDTSSRSIKRSTRDDIFSDDDISYNEGDDEEEEASNQIRGKEDGLGGSAPATIHFDAYTTEGVIHHEWQMSKDAEFETIDYRFNEQNLEYTFTEEGTFYLRYIGSNSDGSCESIGETYKVSIGASELLCPNAFTPNGDGVNDKWKVAYRSLLDFKCWIFDRYGHQMYYFDNPDDGWDGLKGDKPVKPGVYYYVIQATGADGKKYKKSGDINIIRHVERSVSSAGGEYSDY